MERVDGLHVAAQGGLNGLLETDGIGHHEGIGLFVAVALRVVAAGPRIV